MRWRGVSLKSRHLRIKRGMGGLSVPNQNPDSGETILSLIVSLGFETNV